jgi:hypothetical protein
MKRRHKSIVITTALSLVFAGMGTTTAVAKPISYSFKGGSMLTLEYSEVGFPVSSLTTRLGQISKSGKVIPLSDDLGLKEVSQAVYSPQDGKVYVVAGLDGCSVWSFALADPEGTLTRQFDVPNPSPDVSICTAIAIEFGTGNLIIGQDDLSVPSGTSYGYYDRTTGEYFDSEEALGINGPAVLDCNLKPMCFEFSYTGYFHRETLGSTIIRPVKGPFRMISSTRIDTANTPWVLRSMQGGEFVGSFSHRSRKATWGRILKDSVTGSPWRTNAIIFVPRTG